MSWMQFDAVKKLLIFLLLPSLLSCSPTETPPEICADINNPSLACYQPHGEFSLFMDLYEEGFFSHEELKDIVYRNNNDWVVKRGGDPSSLPAGGSLVPRPSDEIETHICDDYYYDYIIHEGKEDVAKGTVLDRDDFSIASYCGEYRGYHIFRFEECRFGGFSAVVYQDIEGLTLEYPCRSGEVLKAWKPLNVN